MLFVGFAALAGILGFEAILGAFVAGAILKVVDRDAQMAHPHTSIKLEALGLGFPIPVFLVTSGLSLDLRALLTSASNDTGGRALDDRPVSEMTSLGAGRRTMRRSLVSCRTASSTA